MKKVLLLVAVVATVSFAACTNKQAAAEKAKADSLAAVALADSLAKAEADSLAALVPDTTVVVEETVVE
ncbi:MAG: hypothetical protein LBR48_09685 [Dysgonamonadaceae bacterium]|nr:hypothetical protein [Dysgonamonadaceae bacterium]